MMKWLSVFIIFSCVCTNVSANENHASILNAAALTELGYKETKANNYNSRRCDRMDNSPVAEKHYQGIKSLSPVKGSQNTYYRFTIISEKFSSVESARKRLQQITRPYGFKSNSWYGKSCAIRKVFQFENTVYLVVTDAARFRSEIPMVIMKLKTSLGMK